MEERKPGYTDTIHFVTPEGVTAVPARPIPQEELDRIKE